ncbi:MAG TPA: hypothetical protein VMG09_07705 [Bacteroidota bacterium]|nr:hypothetical protein [Bacteroidota bacterium]
MRLLSYDKLAHVVGGEYTKSECAGLGFAAGLAVCFGGPIGWVTAGFSLWQAAEGGCFSN